MGRRWGRGEEKEKRRRRRRERSRRERRKRRGGGGGRREEERRRGMGRRGKRRGVTHKWVGVVHCMLSLVFLQYAYCTVHV